MIEIPKKEPLNIVPFIDIMLVVREVNTDGVSREEVLSDNVYIATP